MNNQYLSNCFDVLSFRMEARNIRIQRRREWRHYDGGGCATTPDRIYTAQAAVQVSSALLHRRYSSDAISANDHHFYSPAKKSKNAFKEATIVGTEMPCLNSQRFSVEKKL